MQYDPNGQLAWLIDELQSAKDANQRVYLLAHMLMGPSSALYDGSHFFDEIVNRYSNTIAAMFFGHTHKDEFEISHSNYTPQSSNTATAMSYIAPAMTPTSGKPAFRVYEVDPVTFGVLNFTEYYANISSATYQNGPVWQKLYSAKEAYGALLPQPVTDTTAELTPAFRHNVTELFEANDTVIQEYYSRKTRGYDTSTCTGSCKTYEICQLRAADAQYNCVAVKPGLQFRKAKKTKRSIVSPNEQHGDDCDTPVLSTVLAAILSHASLLQTAVSIIQNATSALSVSSSSSSSIISVSM